MSNSKTIDGVPRDDLHELHVVLCNMEVQDGSEYADIRDRLRALLDAPACSACNDTGRMHEPGCEPGACTACLEKPAARPQGEPVAHCLLRRNGSGNWVNDSKCWVNGLPGQQIVDECEKHPDLYRLRFAYAEQPEPQKYDDTLMPFLALMRKELHANSHKGDREGWLSMTPKQALEEIRHHEWKLVKAIDGDSTEDIPEYAADVANCAMMLADVCGVLGRA